MGEMRIPGSVTVRQEADGSKTCRAVIPEPLGPLTPAQEKQVRSSGNKEAFFRLGGPFGWLLFGAALGDRKVEARNKERAAYDAKANEMVKSLGEAIDANGCSRTTVERWQPAQAGESLALEYKSPGE